MKKITLWLVLFFSVLTIGAQNGHKVQLNPNATSDQPAVVDMQTLAAEAATENSFNLSYYGKAKKPYWYGIGLGDVCDMHAAIFIPEEVAKHFIGRKLTTIKFGMKTLTSTSDYSVWVSENLDNEPLYRQACDVPENPRRLFPVDLKTPYVINGKGFYIGYSMHVDKCINPDHYYPIGVDLNVNHRMGNLMMINDEGWIDYGMEGGLGTLMIEGVCEGNICLNNISLEGAGENTCVKGQEFFMPVTFYNVGKEDVKSLTFQYTVGNAAPGTSTIELTHPVGFMNPGKIQVPVKADGDVTMSQVKIEVTGVNGEPDGDALSNVTNGSVLIVSKAISHKAVVETTAGTWCGFCPRGGYALSLMKEQFPNEVIRISDHFHDDLSTPAYNEYNKRHLGAPKAELNRNGIIDTYYGTSYTIDDKPFGIADDIRAELARACEASVKLNVVREGDWFKFTTDVTFYTNLPASDYKLGYVMIEDGIVAGQSNYYHDEPAYPSLEHLKELPSYIKDYVHNDVARAGWGVLGIENSLEGAIEDGKAKTHVYGVNVESTDTIIKDYKNARLAVLLLNKNGRIVNADVVELGTIETGIEATETTAVAPEIKVANGVVTVKGEGDFVADLYTIDGKKVAGESFNGQATLSVNGLKGVYVVRVSNAASAWVKKVIF